MWGKSKVPPNAAPAARKQLAMPLFATADPIDSSRVIAAWSSLFPTLPALRVNPANDAQYVSDDRVITGVQFPTPIPTGEAVEALQDSWMWKDPVDAVRDHRCYALVAGDTPEDPAAAARDVARLSAALLLAGSGVGLYWGNARCVHSPKVVLGFTRDVDKLPVPLFVGLSLHATSRSGPFSAATHGLEALGHKELEVLRTRMSVGALRMTLYDLALYVLKQGPVLEDGQTFGPDPTTKWKVHHRKSELVPARDSIVLGIP